MRLERTGTVDYIWQEENRNNYKSRNFSITLDGNSQYPEQIKLTLKKDNTRLIDGFQPGTRVTIEFYLGGRGNTNQQTNVYSVFNNLTCVSIKPAGNQQQQPPPQQPNNQGYQQQPPNNQGYQQQPQQPF